LYDTSLALNYVNNIKLYSLFDFS